VCNILSYNKLANFLVVKNQDLGAVIGLLILMPLVAVTSFSMTRSLSSQCCLAFLGVVAVGMLIVNKAV
jgi:hypothetical protein